MRRTALLLASTSLALVLMSSTAWALLTKAADWQMNEPPETPGLMLDSSGNGNNKICPTAR